MNVGEFVKEHRVPLAIGAGGIVLFMVLRNRGGPTVAAQAPVEGVPTQTVSPPAIAQDYGTTGQQASALQQQAQQQALNEQAASSNLAMLGAQQQLQYQGQANALQLQLGQEQLHQQQEVTYGLYRANRPKGAGGLIGAFQRITGLTPDVASQYEQVAAGALALYRGAPVSTPPIGTVQQPLPSLGGQYPAAGQVYGRNF